MTRTKVASKLTAVMAQVTSWLVQSCLQFNITKTVSSQLLKKIYNSTPGPNMSLFGAGLWTLFLEKKKHFNSLNSLNTLVVLLIQICLLNHMLKKLERMFDLIWPISGSQGSV